MDRCLNAADRAGRAIRLVALEKNPNALVTLQERQTLEWGDQVKVQYGDMRRHPIPSSMSERPDIVVSELLGSFGDNELSPECLDGAMRFLKPNGISIPSSYTAFLSPLSSSKLHTEVLNGSNAAPPLLCRNRPRHHTLCSSKMSPSSPLAGAASTRNRCRNRGRSNIDLPRLHHWCTTKPVFPLPTGTTSDRPSTRSTFLRPRRATVWRDTSKRISTTTWCSPSIPTRYEGRRTC